MKVGDKARRKGFIQRFLLRFITNAIALYAAAQLISGIHLVGWDAILLTTVIFGFVNAFIKSLVLIITCLIQIITLGLFTLVINAGMLYLTAWFAQKLKLAFSVDNFLSVCLGAFIVSVVSFILSKMLK